MTEESYHDFYDHEYRNLYGGHDGPNLSFFNEQRDHGLHIYDLLSQHMSISHTSVLEIGCGAGGILDYFKKKGNMIFGVDLGSAYVSYGQQKGLDLKVGTLHSVPSDFYPNIVIYSHVLEHLLDPLGELIRVRKIIKEKGLLYIEVPGVKSLLYNSCPDFLSYLQNAHISHFTLASLSNLLRAAGFEIIYGTEYIRCIARPAQTSREISNDYREVMSVLGKLERMYRNPFHLLKIRNKTFSLAVSAVDALGLGKLVRQIVCRYCQ
jgi:2-polyprenyl-3-methyl-5-hydroxy-6-metoxy-1,4-benzoquinol methylase